MNILWVGYGKMGQPMCMRVAAQGHSVRVLEVSEAQRRAAEAEGLALATDVKSASRGIEVIVTSLPNDRVCEDMLLGPDGLLATCDDGTILIETSTISVAASGRIAAQAEARSLPYVRAPVSGTVKVAADGKLTCFVSGPVGAVSQVRPLIASYASSVVVTGEDEQARVMKLAVNLMVNSLIVSLAEAFTFCRKGGISADVALSAISSSAIASPHLKLKADQLLDHDFTPRFTVSQTRKDMRLIVEAGRDLGAPLPLGALVEQVFTATQQMGFGEEDYMACAKVVAQLAGLDTPSP